MKSLTALGCLLLAACAQAAPADLAIRDVTVVDVTNGTLLPAQTVMVSGNRIVAVGSAADVEIHADAEVVDGTGGYLVPGLWDTHVHSATNVSWHFPLFLAHGITSVRNMHTTVDEPLELVLSVKQQLESGTLLGPRFLANGGVLDGDPPIWPGSVVVRDADEARAAVDRLADGGADFIKVYDRLTPEAYFAILERAQQRGIAVDGHVPSLIRPEEAAAAGQRTFEHTTGINLGCAAGADDLRRDYAQFLERVPSLPPYPDQLVQYLQLVRRAVDARDSGLCVQAARAFHESGVVAVPTLVANADPNAQGFVADSTRMSLLPPALGAEWRGMAAGPDLIAEVFEGADPDATVKNLRVLHEEGVVILAGTDVGNPFLLPGLSLLDELERLSDAGLSTLEVLRSATILPAQTFGLADSLGAVESGVLADMVLLDANPLEDIANIRRIRAVVTDGRLLRRADLDRMLAEVRAMHSKQQD